MAYSFGRKFRRIAAEAIPADRAVRPARYWEPEAAPDRCDAVNAAGALVNNNGNTSAVAKPQPALEQGQ